MKKLITMIALAASVISAPAFAAPRDSAAYHQYTQQGNQSTGTYWFDDQAKGPV